MTYVLFKNAVQLDTLAVIRYLHSRHAPQVSVAPTTCVERRWPEWAAHRPSIETADGRRFVGLDECIRFWSDLTGENAATLLADGIEFARSTAFTEMRIWPALTCH